MTIRWTALLAWALAYLPIYVAWAVFATSCPGMESRAGWLVVLVVIGVVIASGASATEADDEDERPMAHGLVTWTLALGGMFSAALLVPIVSLPLLAIAVLLALFGVRVDVRGAARGFIVAVMGAVVAVLLATLLQPIVDAVLADQLAAATSMLRATSIALVAGAVPTSLAMAAVHVLPPWRGGVAMAVVRGVLVAATMTAVMMFGAAAWLACGK